MCNEDKPETRQLNELEALQSIFGEDLRDVRGETAWNVWKPLDLVITLTPQQGGSGVREVYAKVDLHVMCSKNYPNTIPKIKLEKSQGLSTETLKELQQQLELKTKELIGEVMIFELAQYIQTFLLRHNKPRFESFYEEMLTRRKQEEQIHQLAIQEQKDREREVMLSEILQRKNILKQENKIRKDSNSFGSDSDTSNSNLFFNRKSSGASSESTGICEHKGTKIIDFSNNGFREIQRGACLNHYYDGKCVLYTGIDIETGELFHVWEWTIDTRNTDFPNLQKQLSSIEQEFNYLVKLRHINLLHYINMKQEIREPHQIIVYVLQEFSNALNCSWALFSRQIPSDIDLLRHFSRGILTALEFLHRNNVVHKNISEYCIHLSPSGLVLISNYSIDRRLTDVMNQNSLYNYSKKGDIFKFGQFILGLLKGTGTCEEIEIPLNVSPELYDFLSKCLAKEEKERYTIAQLLSHPFIRNPVNKMSPQRQIQLTSVQNTSPEPPVETNFIQSSSTGQSRIQSEFEVLQFIGKGAFGDVLKVKNKLDGRNYAIKRIELNPKNKQFNRKIIREVKLLSKLNHENVVRYYNAWIEMALVEYRDSSSLGTTSDFTSPAPRILKQKELTFHDDVELLAPPMKDVEWSVGYEGKSKSKPLPDDSSSDESDVEWGFILNSESESDSIEFERDGEDTPKSEPASDQTDTTTKEKMREIQFLYIQMEFCDKSTLRTVIDTNLYLEVNRVWRLFREIVEGLAHIHQQGIIHRDLKPVNIFLDSHDHVKIGDFGLATTNILSRHGEGNMSKIQDSLKEIQSIDDGNDTGLTGQVGTALYTAPELNTTIKTVYSQKVDIYSLGIIFFEMSYIPLTTQMERMKIISGIRQKEIVFPPEFHEHQLFKQKALLRWLLNHDVSQRPTSRELLQSELLPPPVLEEEKLREMFLHTLRNPQLKAYKYLVASCFEQPVIPTHDITYDMDITVNSTKLIELYQYVKGVVSKIFSFHGGQNISTPLLLPKTPFYEHADTCVKLMTHSGSIVSLPYDLRIPFARYVAFNGITLLKRYCIEKVYRERRVFGYHPKEFYECAFDIVTPTLGNFMVDAEVLFIVNEIIDSLTGLKNKNFVIRLNHASLIKAILLHCGIKERHTEFYQLLTDTREGKATKFQIKEFLIEFGLSDFAITTLFSLIELENTLPKITSTLQVITKKKSTEASHLAKQALQELKLIVQNAEALGVSFNIVIVPGLVYNINHYSGMLCQFVCELKKKRRHGHIDVVAAGGRYDSLLHHYRNIKESGKNIRQFAVGISLSLDKLVQTLQKEGEDEVEVFRPLDCILVSSVDSKLFNKEKISVLKNLWASGIRCSLMEATTLEEVQEYCADLKVPHLIILNDTPQGTARIRSWERDRFQEKTVNIFDLVEYMQRIIKIWNEGYPEQLSVSRSDSKSNYDKIEHNHEATVNVLFVTIEKLSANSRRRYENQIRSQMDGIFKKLTGEVIVLGLSVDSDVIRTLSALLNFDSERLFQQSVANVIEKHPRHEKDILEVCDEVYEQQNKKSKPIIFLYSITDSFYKCIL